MAELTFNVERLAAMESTALVKINGAIDAKTVVLFQEKLDQLQKEGLTGFILDMEGIKYVNSTGLGTLVNVADALETRGGGIALIKIHPKVKVVFDMLGLNAFFKIFSTEKQALSHFERLAGGGGAAPSVPLAPPPILPTAVAPVPQPQVKEVAPQPVSLPPASASPSVSAPARVTEALNILTDRVEVPTEPGAPFSLVCAVCKVKLTIPRAGSFKCPRCATFFKLYEDGKVTFSERKKASPLQMKLCCTDECMQGLAEFVGVLAQRIGFSAEDVQSIKDAIIETCSAITEKAYENKQYLSYNIVINPSSTDLKIQISDYGKYIYDDEKSFQHTRSIMDEFEHKQHPKGGNIINMAKCFQMQ